MTPDGAETINAFNAPTQHQLPAIAELLAAHGLPTDDLADQDLSLFLIGEANGAIEVVGGLERWGDSALLRSVATAPARRGQGLARQLVSALEAIAVTRGMDALYLLTEMAEDFFSHLAYVPVDRTEVPQAIRGSTQFSSLCPASATVMRKGLRPASAHQGQ